MESEKQQIIIELLLNDEGLEEIQLRTNGDPSLVLCLGMIEHARIYFRCETISTFDKMVVFTKDETKQIKEKLQNESFKK